MTDEQEIRAETQFSFDGEGERQFITLEVGKSRDLLACLGEFALGQLVSIESRKCLDRLGYTAGRCFLRLCLTRVANQPELVVTLSAMDLEESVEGFEGELTACANPSTCALKCLCAPA